MQWPAVVSCNLCFEVWEGVRLKCTKNWRKKVSKHIENREIMCAYGRGKHASYACRHCAARAWPSPDFNGQVCGLCVATAHPTPGLSTSNFSLSLIDHTATLRATRQPSLVHAMAASSKHSCYGQQTSCPAGFAISNKLRVPHLRRTASTWHTSEKIDRE